MKLQDVEQKIKTAMEPWHDRILDKIGMDDTLFWLLIFAACGGVVLAAWHVAGWLL